jgi:hypothetical protein
MISEKKQISTERHQIESINKYWTLSISSNVTEPKLKEHRSAQIKYRNIKSEVLRCLEHHHCNACQKKRNHPFF